MLWVSRRASRTDRTRAAAIMFGGWLLVAGLVLSFMSGTTHSYYSVALAPPIGALVGIGSHGLWRIRHTWFARATMAVAIAATAAWAWVLLGRSPGFFPWLRVAIVIAAVGAVGMILAGPLLRAAGARTRLLLAAVPVSLAAVAMLGGPLAYSLDTASSSYAGASPSAGPTLTAAGRRPGCARRSAVRSPAARAVVSSAAARAGRGEFGGFAGGLPGGAGAAVAGASAASAAMPRSAPPWPSCLRRAPPGTSGPRPPRPPTPRPRWSWPPVVSRSWPWADSGGAIPRSASPASRSSWPSTRSTTTWQAVADSAAVVPSAAAAPAVARRTAPPGAWAGRRRPRGRRQRCGPDRRVGRGAFHGPDRGRHDRVQPHRRAVGLTTSRPGAAGRPGGSIPGTA